MDPSTAAKLTLINLNEALRNAVRFIGKVVISPLNFIAQLYHLFTIDDLTQSSSFISLYAQYDQDPPGTRIESLRLAGFLSRSKAPFSNFSEIGFNTIQVSLYNGVGDFSWKHSLLGRIVAIPVITIDAALEVLKPLIAAVETIVKAILIVPVMIIWHIYQGDRISRDLRVGTFFNSFNYAIDYLAQSVSMLVLSPINLIVQLGKALKNPSRLSPIMAQTGTTFLKSEDDDKKSNANIRFEGLYCIGQKQQKYISKHGTMIAELEKSYATGYISLSKKQVRTQFSSFDDD